MSKEDSRQQNMQAVVDGANVAYVEKSQAGKPKVSNIQAVRQSLLDKGAKPTVIVDASFRYEVDDPEQLESLIDTQVVRQAPAGTDADFFVLETAERQDALIVSNDTYEEYQERYDWIEERRIPVMIVNGEVELYKPKLP